MSLILLYASFLTICGSIICAFIAYRKNNKKLQRIAWITLLIAFALYIACNTIEPHKQSNTTSEVSVYATE